MSRHTEQSEPRVRLRQRRPEVEVIEEDAARGLRLPGPPLTDDQRKARDLLNGPAKHLCLVGGSRSGKTSIIIRNMIIRALKADESRHLITRFRSNALRASIWLDTYPKVLKMWFPGTVSKEHRQDGFEELPNGSQIWFGGLDEKERVDKVLGQEYATIFNNEVSQTPYASILTVRTRLAQMTKLKLKEYNDLNPTTVRHWSNLEFGLGKSPLSRESLPDPENYQRAFLNPEGNAINLDSSYVQSLKNLPKMYRKRFYEGDYLMEVEGALWSADTLETCRTDPIIPDPSGNKLADFRRIVIGVDPSGAKNKDDKKSDEIGIVACGRRHSNRMAVLEDATLRDSPTGWAARAVATYRKWHADCIVAEANFGGAMVESTIKAIDRNVNVKLVNASRGKMVRAEPIAQLYDEGKVEHCGQFPELEEQLCEFNLAGYQGSNSPDRADGMVWAATDLMIDQVSTYTLANIR